MNASQKRTKRAPLVEESMSSTRQESGLIATTPTRAVHTTNPNHKITRPMLVD